MAMAFESTDFLKISCAGISGTRCGVCSNCEKLWKVKELPLLLSSKIETRYAVVSLGFFVTWFHPHFTYEKITDCMKKILIGAGRCQAVAAKTELELQVSKQKYRIGMSPFPALRTQQPCFREEAYVHQTCKTPLFAIHIHALVLHPAVTSMAPAGLWRIIYNEYALTHAQSVTAHL